jgi:hypothetical protein
MNMGWVYSLNQTHIIYITLMGDEYGLGLQPQSPHFTMSYCL